MRWLCLVLAPLLFSVKAASAQPRISGNQLVALRAAAATTPLLGADLVNTDPALPYCWNGSIVPDYGDLGVRIRTQDALAAMRAAGLQSFRIFLYHQHGDSTNTNVVPSTGGRLPDPFRTNLINLLTDIRKAGFLQVTIAFNPWGPNDPTGRFSDGSTYDLALFAENWAFIQDVRSLLKQYGPSSTHIDLLNEGASTPSEPTFARIEDYITRMYADYVDAFGADDVTVSAGFWPGMAGLVQALRASGKPMPRWFDVHPRWDPADELQDLRAIDAELNANGLSQPLVIGEDGYNDAATANALAEFIHTTSRQVIEVMEWPTLVEGSVVQPSCPRPPYRIDAYATALMGALPASTLTANLTSAAYSFTTPYGDPVTALEAGSYTLDITDRSSLRGFAFAGRSTTRAFKGTRSWTLSLQPGSYQYRILGRPARHGWVNVLPSG